MTALKGAGEWKVAPPHLLIAVMDAYAFLTAASLTLPFQVLFRT
jgi:hypothetical protein